MEGSNMLNLKIPDMTCDHCKKVVENAIASVDPSSSIAIDLDTHQAIVMTSVPSVKVMAALKDAGYEAKELS